MSAYIIAEVDVHDPEAYERYKSFVPRSLEPFGGRFVVRGGATELLEGEPDPKRIVVIEFEDAARAKAWWSSEGYAEPKALRQAASTSRLLIVEGA